MLLIVSITSTRKEIYLGTICFILVYFFINVFANNKQDTSKDRLWLDPIFY